MDFKTFDANRKKYGACSSWAVWNMGACEHLRYAPDAVRAPKFYLNRAVASLNGIASQADLTALGWTLNPNVVLVALNFAERDDLTKTAIEDIAFHAFHEETTTTSDQRLRDACCGTPMWGGYITDLVKIVDGRIQPIRNSQSKPIKKMLSDECFRTEQVNGLVEELQQLQVASPVIISLGNDVHNVLTRPTVRKRLNSQLGRDTRILKITHYSKAAAIRHSDYVARVYNELRTQSFF